jgi:hypothetical protein
VRIVCSIIFALVCVGNTTDSLAQYTFTTAPSPPIAWRPFDVSITGTFPSSYFIVFDPQVSMVDGLITVELHGSCEFICTGPTTATKTFTMPALPPGSYVMTARMDLFSTQFGQFAFVVAPPLAVPALSSSGIATLMLMLGVVVWIRQRTNTNDA